MWRNVPSDVQGTILGLAPMESSSLNRQARQDYDRPREYIYTKAMRDAIDRTNQRMFELADYVNSEDRRYDVSVRNNMRNRFDSVRERITNLEDQISELGSDLRNLRRATGQDPQELDLFGPEDVDMEV